MGHHINLGGDALAAAFEHLADSGVDADTLADRYRTAVLDLDGVHLDLDGGATVPVAPSEMVELVSTVADADETGRDWSELHLVALEDGRVCLFGVRTRCGDGCCEAGVFEVAESAGTLTQLTEANM